MALNSKTTLKIIDALCEGPIEGLVETGDREKKSVFLNETIVTRKQLTDKTVQFFINGCYSTAVFGTVKCMCCLR